MNSVNKNPLETLMSDPTVSEILINDFDKIYFEREGRLLQHGELFSSYPQYLIFIEQLCEKLHRPLNREQPFLETQLDKHRYSLVFGELSAGPPLLSIRKQNFQKFSFDSLVAGGWCAKDAAVYIQNTVQLRKNILIVGATSSGKTTSLQSMLNLVDPNERCVVIEDTKEIAAPNAASVTLLSREFGNGSILPVKLEDLSVVPVTK